MKLNAPVHLLNQVRSLTDAAQLSMTPTVNFDTKFLKKQSDLNLAKIFSNHASSDSWDTSHEKIHSLYAGNKQTGGVNIGDRRILYYLAIAQSPKRILKIGTNIGSSTLHLAYALKQIRSDSRITTVDIDDVNHPEAGVWRKIGLPLSPLEMSEQLGCLDIIDFKTTPSLDFMNSTEHRYDFIFLDGDHRAKTVYQEVSAALSLFGSDGIIILHDYYPRGEALFPDEKIISGPYLALEKIMRENSDIGVLPLGRVPWQTKQDTNLTSLAIVVKKG
ncbi:MAG TPA: CmcI family methyltransferase [Thermohalobaculum sp.]|nr:CmcI family methyltransferase [Thermohalobaculum sp.]